MKSQIDLKEIANFLKVLADPTRLRLISLLASNMAERLSVSELANMLHISQPAATQHLNVLKYIGILYSYKDHLRIYYYLNFDQLRNQKELLDQFFTLAPLDCDLDEKCIVCQNREFCDSNK
jgi:DNA-binding transcriptional ArsR family regulator